MLGHDDLLQILRDMKERKETSNADLSRLLKIPTSRIADIFATDRKARKIKVNEMKAIIEHYGLQGEPALPVIKAEIYHMIDTLSEADQRRTLRYLRSLHDDDDVAAS